MLKIAVIGPESTGKSTLAQSLATMLKGYYHEEYAREYVAKHPDYQFEELLTIAQKQKELRESSDVPIQIFDTELICIKIWSEVRYQKVDARITKAIEQQDFNLYLLTNLDVPWQPDGIRENEKDREAIYACFLEELSSRKLAFKEIKGFTKEERLALALDYIGL